MKHAHYLLALGIALVVLWMNPRWVQADEGGVGLPDAERATIDEVSPPTLFGSPVLDESVLAIYRGGAADHYLNEIKALGTVSEVSASDLVTGHNLVTNGALAGASGMPMFIQNSGNGVLIQNAVIVKVEVN